MARTHTSARAAGSRFERAIADYLATHIDDRIDRRVKTGAKDRGDIGGLRHMGGRIVLECKDYAGRYLLGPWLREVEIERGNDDAMAGAVVIKRRGVSDPGDQVVAMTVRDLVALLTGERPHDFPASTSTPGAGNPTSGTPAQGEGNGVPDALGGGRR